MSKTITVKEILGLILELSGAIYQKEIYADDVVVVDYKDYLYEILLIKELTKSERKARELWKLLITLDFLIERKTNQYATRMVFRVGNAAELLKLPSYKPGVRPKIKPQTEEVGEYA